MTKDILDKNTRAVLSKRYDELIAQGATPAGASRRLIDREARVLFRLLLAPDGPEHSSVPATPQYACERW